MELCQSLVSFCTKKNHFFFLPCNAPEKAVLIPFEQEFS